MFSSDSVRFFFVSSMLGKRTSVGKSCLLHARSVDTVPLWVHFLGYPLLFFRTRTLRGRIFLFRQRSQIMILDFGEVNVRENVDVFSIRTYY